MEISVDRERVEAFSQRQFQFYLGYSSFILRALEKSSFQKFLHWMLKKEKIDEQIVKVVHIRVLPLKRKSGQGVAGKCAPDRGRIRIYPKTIKFCQIFRQRFGKNTLFAYAGNRARAALIHELLHLKYTEEEIVRELAEEYFGFFTQGKSKENSQTLQRMIFKTKSGRDSPPNFSTALATPLTADETCLRTSSPL